MRRVRLIGLPLAAAIWLIYIAWLYPQISPAAVHHRLTPLQAVPFALVLAYGLALQAALFWRNRHRLHSVLRPTRGHAIGAVALTIVTPFGVVGWFPWILGAFLPNLVLAPRRTLVLIFLAVLAAWYPFASNLVSGIGKRFLRVAAFALMFWAAYAALVLVFGVQTFRL